MKVLNSSIVLALFAAGCACEHPADVLAPGTASAKAKQEVADQRVGPGSPLLKQQLPGPPPAGRDPQYQTDGPSAIQGTVAEDGTTVPLPGLVPQKNGQVPVRTGAMKSTAVRNKMLPTMRRRRPGAPGSGSWMGKDEQSGRGGPANKANQTSNMMGVS